MGRIGAYLHVDRVDHEVRPVEESVSDNDEFVLPLPVDEQCEQASRCMDCGVAFCQSGVTIPGRITLVGCPLQNLIPETNDLLYRRRWDDAVGRLYLTNPFPEFTGRVCPSPCEAACNLGLHQSPVTIHDNERALSDLAWERGMDPLPAATPDAPKVAVVGSGPAGLAAAWELARRGMRVRVIERDDRLGGLLMYGIPNMKLPKDIVERRIDLMERSGIVFDRGRDGAQDAAAILADADAVVLAAGAGVPRDMQIPGRTLKGIHFAVEYLTETTRALLEDRAPGIDASGKDVVVIGGGDTGVDCVASAVRQGAKSVTQVIRAQRPADQCDDLLAWPYARQVYSQGYGQREAEGVYGQDPRIWSVDTIEFIADANDSEVAAVRIQDLSYEGGRHLVEGTERDVPAQLVLIAKGFLGTEHSLFSAFGAKPPQEGDQGHRLQTLEDRDASPIFVAGDARVGASLVASAIADGLACAEEVVRTLKA